MADNHQLQEPRFQTAVWTSSISIGIALAGFAAARFVVPLSSSLHPGGVWIAVQIILLLLWKLSHNNSSNNNKPLKQNLENIPEPSPGIHQVSPGEVSTESESTPTLPILKSFKPPTAQDSDNNSPKVKNTSSLLGTKKPGMSKLSVGDGEEEYDSMEATWKAIMDGGATPVRKSYIEDELSGRSEAFIKMQYDRLRAAAARGV